MNNLPLICLVFSLVFFAIGGFVWLAPAEPHRAKLISMGLFFYILSILLTK